MHSIKINNDMEISISLKSHAQNQVAHLVALLRTMDFVENVKVQPDTLKTTKIAKNRFDKYNGVWKNKLSNEDIDQQLNAFRNEWERTI
jgi:hypothetical protein